jgi:hypothetical protein
MAAIIRTKDKNSCVTKEDLENLEKICQIAEKSNLSVERKFNQEPKPSLLPDIPDQFLLDYLELPDHLKKTAKVIYKTGRANADEVAQHTTRARAVESGYLNQLVIMGNIKKERVGRKTYFFVEKI